MSVWIAVLTFVVAATVLVRAGISLAASGDQLAERTGLGRMFVGMIFVAFATSLPEVLTDVSAAIAGSPDLAAGDLFGSSMANMAILAVLDLLHRGRVWPAVELGHSRVASVAIGLTALAALGVAVPSGLRLGWVGPVPILIVVLYAAAVAWFRRSPVPGAPGRPELEVTMLEPTGWTGPPAALRTIVWRFLLAAGVILVSAPVVAIAAQDIARETGIEETFVGALLLAVTTSLPELVASLAALRIGSYDLAVGNLFGSNAANMVVFLFADLAYTDGPLLSAVNPDQVVPALGAILLMALAASAIVGGTETRIKRSEPDAVVLLIAYVGALAAVAVTAA